MTEQDIGDALELFTSGMSIRELSQYYGCNPVALNKVFKEITTFRNRYDRTNNTTLVLQHKIITKSNDNIDYQ